ncbi:hypothetical protein UlMin_034842 [Ulmus minor]
MSKLHNLVSHEEKECILKKNKRSHEGLSEDKKLELSLAPPGEDQSSVILFKEAVKLKRSAARAPVVGWPPVRSSRKNLGTGNFSKSNTSCDETPKNEIAVEEGSGVGKSQESKNHMFVKINMEGVPIGRKVDLKAYDSYEKLSYAIDELFRGLLEAQRDYSGSKSEKTINTKETTDSFRATNGEYTLVYEDNEGDRVLVGDVPWQMFVSTAKRLRVLKSSELISTLKLNSSPIEKTPFVSKMDIGR